MKLQLLAFALGLSATATAAAVSTPDGKPTPNPTLKTTVKPPATRTSTRHTEPSKKPDDIEIICDIGYDYCGYTLLDNNGKFPNIYKANKWI